jgi:hypothetical protein
MHIVESILIRAEDPSPGGLLAALDHLIEADRQLIWAVDRPRLRMRLLMERLKILRRLQASPSADAASFGAWAYLDQQRLQSLARVSGSALWIRMTGRVRRLPKPRPSAAEREAVSTKRKRNSRAKPKDDAARPRTAQPPEPDR